MVRNMTIAAELGYLKVPENVLVDFKKAKDIPDDKIVYMSTGSQGEPMAVLSRMVNKDHQIEVGTGDTVILASSLIPETRTRSTASSTASRSSAPTSCTRATPRCTSPGTHPPVNSSTSTTS
jgi:mRNA degradation ribonuclease J1/J2